MAQVPEFPVSQAMKRITITVKLSGLKTLAWRMKMGMFLFRLAARVIGCNVEIEGPQCQ
jgi:hypothetical protein